MAAIGADDDPRLLCDGAATPAVPDTRHTAVVARQLVDGEVLAYLGTRLGRCVNEDLVKHRAPGREDVGHAVEGSRRAAKDEVAEDEAIFARGGQPLVSTRSSRPQRCRREPPGGQMKCVEIVSLGKLALSTSSTR